MIYVLLKNTDVGAVNTAGRTILHEAAFRAGTQDAIIMHVLLSHKRTVDPNVAGAGGVRPLMVSSTPAAVRSLVEAGAEVDCRDDAGRTAVFHAARRGLVAVLEALIADAGADVNAADTLGQTALFRCQVDRKRGGVCGC